MTHESGLIEDIVEAGWKSWRLRDQTTNTTRQEKITRDAHLKSLLLHHETTLPVTNGRLDHGNRAVCVLTPSSTASAPSEYIVKVLGIS